MCGVVLGVVSSHNSLGSISIGGVSIHDVLSSELYKMVKVVPQEDELMNCTLLENMRLATDREIGEQDVVRALTIADAWDFVKVSNSNITPCLSF